MVDAVRDFYMPGLLIVRLDPSLPEHNLGGKTLKSFKMIQDAPTAYMCHNKVCQLPVTEPEKLAEDLVTKYVFDYVEYEN